MKTHESEEAMIKKERYTCADGNLSQGVALFLEMRYGNCNLQRATQTGALVHSTSDSLPK
jgi:hypothetical protein